jgi:hypothetical protein
MDTQEKGSKSRLMKAFLTQVMIKSKEETLICVMRALQREAYTAPLAVCPPPKKQQIGETFCKIERRWTECQGTLSKRPFDKHT